MDFLDDGREAQTHAVVPRTVMSIVILVWEIQCHFNFEQLLLFRWLVPEGLLIKGEANDHSLDGSALLVQLLIFLKLFWCFSLQLYVSEQSIFRNYHVEIVLLHAQHFHLHYHVPFQGFRVLP
jgi:hypothetical protein